MALSAGILEDVSSGEAGHYNMNIRKTNAAPEAENQRKEVPKMKKLLALILALTMVLTLAACGGSAAEFDPAAMTDSLLASDCFSVALEELPSSKASVFYGLPAESLQSAVMYHGSGTSKEQLAVFTATDEAAAKQFVDLLQQQTNAWIEADKDYAPAEAAKLKDAILRQTGNTVIYVVAADADSAAHLVGKYL